MEFHSETALLTVSEHGLPIIFELHLRAVITVRDEGNTTIRVATGGIRLNGGTQWTVYPYVDDNPTLEGFDRGKKERINALSTTGFRDKGDFGGSAMQKEIVEAIALLYSNLGERDHAKDLKLVVNKIDVDPDGEIAKLLESEHRIAAIEKESQAPVEVKG